MIMLARGMNMPLGGINMPPRGINMPLGGGQHAA